MTEKAWFRNSSAVYPGWSRKFPSGTVTCWRWASNDWRVAYLGSNNGLVEIPRSVCGLYTRSYRTLGEARCAASKVGEAIEIVGYEKRFNAAADRVQALKLRATISELEAQLRALEGAKSA